MHILIVSGHALLRDALKAYLRREGAPFWKIASCGDFEEAQKIAAKENPDMILIHHKLLDTQDGNMLSLFTQLCADHSVVILGEFLSAADAQDAMQRGAAGYVAKSMTGGDLLSAVQPFISKNRAEAYTPRENEVHELLQKGLANKEIATMLDIAVVTVKLHVRNILRKAGVTSRTRLLAQRS